MRQRLQRIAAARGQADQQDRTGQRGQHAQPLAEPRYRMRLRTQAIERAQEHRADQQQRRPAQHRQPRRQHRSDHPQRDTEQQEAEHTLGRLHPAARARQQIAGSDADQQQRHAHADRHREQRGAAGPGVATLRDIGQRAGQRRGHAGTDDQRRDRAHRGRARDLATRAAIGRVGQPRLPALRQLQFIQAEHRQRQRHHQRGEQRQYPGRLQRRREPFADQPGGDADRGVDHRHAEHIGQRHDEGAAAVHVLADHDR